MPSRRTFDPFHCRFGGLPHRWVDVLRNPPQMWEGGLTGGPKVCQENRPRASQPPVGTSDRFEPNSQEMIRHMLDVPQCASDSEAEIRRLSIVPRLLEAFEQHKGRSSGLGADGPEGLGGRASGERVITVDPITTENFDQRRNCGRGGRP